MNNSGVSQNMIIGYQISTIFKNHGLINHGLPLRTGEQQILADWSVFPDQKCKELNMWWCVTHNSKKVYPIPTIETDCPQLVYDESLHSFNFCNHIHWRNHTMFPSRCFQGNCSNHDYTHPYWREKTRHDLHRPWLCDLLRCTSKQRTTVTSSQRVRCHVFLLWQCFASPLRPATGGWILGCYPLQLTPLIGRERAKGTTQP